MNLWDLIAIQPISNILIILTDFLFRNFALAIIALTVIFNLALLPLTLKQIRTSKAVQDMQPKLAEIQRKYAKDKQKLAQEQMRLYRESGMSPVGCMVPLLVQMPIWIALYRAITLLLGITPEDFLGLARYLYSWPVLYSALPLNNSFLWANLALPDITLAVLVGVSMWVQQKMMPPMGAADPSQQTQNRMLQWMMPLMFAYITVLMPSGLALYWVASSIVRIVAQYFVTGWGGLTSIWATGSAGKEKKPKRPLLKQG